MIILLSIIVFLLLVYGITTSILLYKMVQKEESLEEFYETKINAIEEQLIQVKIQMENTVEGLRQVDIRGSFEADDEVGFAFKEIKKLNEELLEFIVQYNKSQNAQESQSNQ